MLEEKKASMKEGVNNINNCPTRLLDDLPADHDAFGSHQRVAKALADLIRTEEGGKTIALIGHWGSGKSTVVELLKKEFPEDSEDKDTKIFVFDAWEHRGDPLRRSFLERLYRFLVQQGWVQEGQWDKELDKIRKRREEIDTETQPILSTLGKWLAASLLLVPVGHVLLSAGLSVDQLNGWLVGIGSFFIVLPFVIAFVLPFVIAFVAWMMRSFRKKPWLKKWKRIAFVAWMMRSIARNKRDEEKGNKNQGDREKEQDESLLLFINKTRETIRTKATRTPDPTSIEFQELFVNILNDALSGQRRLVVIIDNLDRIDEEEARSIWATMRAFFEVSNPDGRPPWMKRFWLLVPFAPDTPSRLWRENTKEQPPNAEGKDSQQNTSASGSTGKTSQRKPLAEEFVDKTFQVKFYVPLPIMSDWKAFFKEQLQIAFPEHFNRHKGDLHAIYRIFERKRPSKHRPPTPREIKLFINQLGSYHRIWQDEIPLTVQALYVLDISPRIEAEGPEAVLIHQLDEVIKDIEHLLNKPKLQEHLAAFHFNIEVNKAMQVLIGGEVREALYSGDGKKLKELQDKVDPQAFLTVVDQEIFDELNEWISNEPPALARAALALRDLKQDASEEWGQIWGNLVKGSREAKWADLNEIVGKGLVTILQKSRSEYESVARDILTNISEPSAPDREGEASQGPDAETVSNWTKGLVQVLNEVYESDHRDLLTGFQIPGDAAFYVEVMRSLAEGKVENQRLAEYFAPKATPSEIVQQLRVLCQQGKLSDPYAYAIQFMLRLEIAWPWQQLVPALQQRLRTPNPLQPQELKGCLKTLLYLEMGGIQGVQNALQQLSTQGHLLYHLYYASESKDQKALGLCLLPILEHIPSGQSSAQPGPALQGKNLYQQLIANPPDDLVKSIATLSCEFHKGDKLLQAVAKERRIQRIVADILQEVARQGRAAEFVSSSGVVEHYKILLSMVQSNMLPDDQLQNLVVQLVKDGELLRELVKVSGFYKALADLYLRVYQACKVYEDKNAFTKFLAESLRALSKEEWLEELKQESDLLKLVFALVEDKVPIGLSQRFSSALFEHAKSILNDGTYPSKFVHQWHRLLDALEEDSKTTFLRDLRDEIVSNVDKNVSKLLSLYGDALIKSKVLEEDADRVVRRWLVSAIERRDSQELGWLAKLLAENASVFQKSPEATQTVFRRAVEGAWEEDTDEQAKVHLQSIAKAIGLELKSPPEPEEPESEAPDEEEGDDEE